MKRLLVLTLCGALTACLGGPSFSARVISTLGTVGTGEQRVLVELRGAESSLTTVEGTPTATLRNEDGAPLGTFTGELVWIVPGAQPAYAFLVDIPEAGTYQLTVDGGALGETPPAGLVAVGETTQVGVGEPAPPIDGENVVGPELVVFANLERCPSQSCQPMIDQVASEADNSGLSWRVVDVFLDPDAEDIGDLVAPVVEDWGLPSQPWLYAIDDSGTVTAVFEGALSDRELEDATALISK